MKPILLEWGTVVIPAWHTFFALGAVAAYFFLIWLSRKHCRSIQEAELGWLFAFSYVGGYFGARLLSVFVDQSELMMDEKFFALFQLGPMTFYGGFIGATIAGLMFAWIKRLSLPDIADMAIPCGLLGLAIGRIGCFLNGDDYGIPLVLDRGESPPWWAVTFSNHADPVPRYPVQLLETVFVGIIVLLGTRFFSVLRKAFFPGAVALIVSAGYAAVRFFLEFLRGDPRGSVLGGLLSTSQAISIIVLLFVNVIFLVAIKRGNSVRE